MRSHTYLACAALRPAPDLTRLREHCSYGVSGPCENAAPHLAVRDGDWKYLENADGSRRELYKLDLYNASASSHPPKPVQLDWHEMNNLVDAEAERASQMAYALHSWVQSLPDGPSWAPNQGCQGFQFPTGGGPSTRSDLPFGLEAAVRGAQDSAPDW